MSLEGHAHGLRGLGVTDVESLALQTETSAKAGLPAPARRILRRALLARSRKLEVADDARRREQTAQQAKEAAISATLSGDRVRPQTAADFRDRTPPRFRSNFSSAASLGIGKDWHRPSARARSKRRQQRDGSVSPARPSTAPPGNSASEDGERRDSSVAPQHRQGFVGRRRSSSNISGRASLGVMSSIAAHVVADRISSASGSRPQDNRRFSVGGFALSNRSDQVGPSVSAPVLGETQACRCSGGLCRVPSYQAPWPCPR